MKATIISTHAHHLQALAELARAEHIDVLQTAHRQSGEPLQPLLVQAAGSDLLVSEGCGPDLAADLAALGALTATSTTAVVLLCARQDSDTLLAAMRAGIREVLPTPPVAADFQAALRRVAARLGPARISSHRRGRVVVFVACKGGSGATFLATNLSYVLATEQKQRVALMDLDLQYGDAAYFVTDGRARANLADLARQSERLDTNLLRASMTSVAPDFDLLPAPEEPEAALGITSEQLGAVIDVARNCYDFLVLDVERMLDPLSIKALDEADSIFLVAENMIPHVRDTKRLVRILRALGYPESKLRLVLNRFDRDEGLTLDQVEKAVGLKIAHTIPQSQDVADAVNAGTPLPRLHPHNAVSRSLREIAEQLDARPRAAARNWLGRLVGETT